MSMSMHVVFFRDPEGKALSRKIDVAYQCQAAEVSIPPDLVEYLKPVWEEYGGLPEDCEDALDCMLEAKPLGSYPEPNWSDEHGRQGFEIKLADLPKDVAVVRFYCS